MSVNSKRKGSAAEREVAQLLREAGYKDARRGLQYQSGQIEADVVGVPGIHIEVKIRAKQFSAENLYEAMAQSMRDSKEHEKSVVIHRTARHPWLVSMSLDEWLDLLGGTHGKYQVNEEDGAGDP